MSDAALIFVNSEGVGTLASPGVGLFRPCVEAGQWLSMGEVLGTLEVLGREQTLRVPSTDHVFQVTELLTEKTQAVGYKTPLMRLAPAGEVVRGAAGALAQAETEAGVPEGAIAVRAPTDGLFYASPSPEDPPFVQVGQVIKDGQVVGLLEVMKFFYEIKFEADGCEAGARVFKVTAANSAPLRTGDVVAWAEPL